MTRRAEVYRTEAVAKAVAGTHRGGIPTCRAMLGADQAMSQGWNRAFMTTAHFEIDDMALASGGLYVPKTGIYSARFQAMLEHQSLCQLSDMHFITQTENSIDVSTVYFQELEETDALFTPSLVEGDEDWTGWYDGVAVGFTGSVTGSATVDFRITLNTIGGDTLGDLDILVEVHLTVNGAIVATESMTVPVGATTDYTISVSEEFPASLNDVVAVKVRATGDFGPAGSQIDFRDNVSPVASTFTVSRGDGPASGEIAVGLLRDPVVGAVAGLIVLATAAVVHHGSAVNVAFAAEEGDLIIGLVYVPPGVGQTDVSLKRAAEHEGLPSLSELNVTGEIPPETPYVAEGYSELSAHWVTAGEGLYEWVVPA